MNEAVNKQITWLKGVIESYRNESNKGVSKMLAEFGRRFEDKSEKRQEFNEHLIKTKKLFDEETGKLVQQIKNLQNQIKKAQEKVDSKEEEIQSLDQLIKQADVNKDEVTFVFEADNITAFLRDSESYERRFSEYFQCSGIRWYLDISQSPLSDGQKVLSVTLHSHNPDKYNWNIQVDFDLSVLNQSGKEDSPVLSYANETFKSRGENFDDNIGCINFISIETIKSGGFIRNDAIKVQVKLKANTKLIREVGD